MTISHTMRIGSHALIAAALLVVSTAAGLAGEMTHVIELFTSQGCSSCPPADRLLATLARNPNTVALSFPVDYWDYIGWKDIFASPIFTARQQASARSSADGRVYTPQVVIDGIKADIGSDKASIDRDIGSPSGLAGGMSVPMSISESDGFLHVDVGAGRRGDAGVYVLRVVRSRTVEIGRGENSGRSVTYTNVVRAMNKIGDWTGGPAHFDMLELKGDGEGYVVLLQSGSPETPALILAAAKTAGL
jgi:hypothetical protein